MTTTSESLLFRLQQVGETPDETAWRRFVSIYTPLIFYWARKVGLRQTEASDLVQDVLTQVFQKLPEFKYDSSRSFRGWLRTVTLNRYREIHRRKSSRLATATDSMLENLAPVSFAESTWDIDYARLLVARAMELMQDDFAPGTWDALKLVMSGGQSVDAAAEQTGVSAWTIYSARARLMKRLRAELGGLL
ncbi:RNA polymerase sigma factor [Mariniblastus fucicola]|uniref:RNA polymerase sigma factor n=1 Tax=Mariniblastus fucicola TaxID=980251 RepID=A0A5B9PBG2_9BACT|nr:sigma-70 family RNA polymerase sigma factor [Mariniblastus fucicola]QEG20463.1 RNA polymerase sigma factor [Mariniblastus fucicola]